MNRSTNLINHINCQNCSISQLCLPFTLDQSSMERLDAMIERKRPYQRGDALYRAGEKLESLFAVRSGSVKSYALNDHGELQITAFHLPGDLVGFEAISDGKHHGYAEAMETSMICEIPFENLETLSGNVPALRRQLMRLMSEEINADKRMLTLLNTRTAEQRLATFLVELSARFRARGLSSREFRLTMTRAEIGNYLGLTVETVSRLFGKFQKQSLIAVEGRLVQIIEAEALSETAGLSPTACL
ncbi:fumarate/nitrate reduction transcriptional regulator Fnr [Aliidiomarina sanyensis]|uniref:Transcriptional regulator FNR n=1 Tax=Aliidiomarina sanyensis TaxID=1249555 RepID=A0A432WRX5_9GAMM|nr:fumarate/nitrate reduction transcriptional regulator Fnr [Aliidiomarina sanyensis]RUO36511.1 transcriptional regulator FNR [Aliidiomarina sanyensis]